MSKAVKKKSRRMWRTMRKTLGTLFLVSALVIAAIPVDGLRASNGVSTGDDVGGGRDDKYSWQPECEVPELSSFKANSKPEPEIYVDKNRNLEFVYKQFPGFVDNDWHIVITKYNGGLVDGGTLTIPDTVSAYKLYNVNMDKYAAVGRNGNFLFYRNTTTKTYNNVTSAELQTPSALDSLVKAVDSTNKYVSTVSTVENTQTDPDTGAVTGTGTYTAVLEVEEGYYLPCYAPDKTSTGVPNPEPWESLPESRLYYDTTNPTGGESVTEPGSTHFDTIVGKLEYGHISGIKVDYIAKEYHDGTEWKIITEDSKGQDGKIPGIFTKETNFSKVVLGKNLKGVGNYAFYGTGITDITFTNALRTIGEGAFRGCRRLTTVNLVTEGDQETSLTDICAYAFQDCTALKSFDVPWSVDTIGDGVFAGCSTLETVNLCNPGAGLEHVGLDAFSGCAMLRNLTFPQTCKDPLYLSTFAGCTKLEYICARAPEMTFMDDEFVTYKSFKESLQAAGNNAFYFEGQEGSELQKMCRDPKDTCPNMTHSGGCKDTYFAFSYIDGSYAKRGLYELTSKDPMSASGTGRNIFVVTEKNELYQYIPQGDVKSITIPPNIGPYKISTIRGGSGDGIDEGAFANLCNLETVVIPSTVSAVGDYAFVGCHNLTTVIFDGFDLDKDNPDNIIIGANAFQTQNFTLYNGHTCTTGVENEGGAGSPPKNKLNFIGPISANFGPFAYAMSRAGSYNNTSQATSYITYYTGWPYNLKVEYDTPDLNDATKDRSKLTDFPALGDLTGYADDATDPLYYYYNLMEKNVTAKYLDALKSAAANYADPDKQWADLSPNEQAAINSALKVTIPDGITAIEDGLFYSKGLANNDNMTVTAYSSLKEIKSGTYTDGNLDPGTGTFAGCTWLTEVELWPGSGATNIEDYAFQDCTGLTKASIDDNSTLGECPFYGCDELSDVNFGATASHYTCKDGIIYGADSSGNFSVIVECLGGKTGYIEPADLAGVTALKDAAFKGSRVSQIDLSKTTITEIPPRAFADTPDLRRLLFPSTLTTIKEKAFEGSGVNYIFASNATNSLVPSFIDITAFDGLVDEKGDPRTDYKEVEWKCEPGTNGEAIGINKGFNVGYATGESIWTVTFWDWSSSWNQNVEVSKVSVESGDYIFDFPDPRGRDGMVFKGWKIRGTGEEFTSRYAVVQDMDVEASYDIAPPDYGKVTVTFLDHDGTVIRKVAVEPGTDMTTHEDYKNLIPVPSREGFVFTGWDRELTNITKDLEVKAQYRAKVEGECIVRYLVDGNVYQQLTLIAGSQAPSITPPTIEGKTFERWLPTPGIITGDTDYYAVFRDGNGNTNNPGGDVNGSGNNTGNNTGGNNTGGNNTGSSNNTGSGNNTGSSNATAQFHTLTVDGGSGSGSYIAGTQIIIRANAPARGQEFSGWTVSPSNTVVTDKSLSSAIITMPNNDVAVIANYKARTSNGSSSTVTGSSSNTNTNRPNGSTGQVGGTTVVIDKNGLSNTGVVSATVNGSSDNFTIKITESSSATEAVLKALQAEYGDLNNLKYFPMDISLYDSTGTTKITDTTGLSVSITLPLPDSLITYAGNNKVAGVVNDRLDKLTPRFTTIDGVSCITFTAEHFSPYVIYVDITNLSDSTISDTTPKTGDGIHPKWFLSIGLACLSFVMFMIKDNKGGSRKKQKVTVKARN